MIKTIVYRWKSVSPNYYYTRINEVICSIDDNKTFFLLIQWTTLKCDAQQLILAP